MLIVSLLFFLLCTILYIVVKPFLLLLILRFFQGIWFSVVTTAANSIAADIVPESRKGTGLGYFSISVNLGIVIGPFIGITVVQLANFDLLFIILAILLTIGALLALPIKLSNIELEGERSLKFSLSDLIEMKALPVALLGMFVSFSYSSVLSFISIYSEQKGLLTVTGYFYILFAAIMIAIRPLTGRFYDTVGPKYVIIPSFLLFSGGLVMLGFMEGPILFLISALLIGAGYSTLVTSFQTLSVQATSLARSAYATSTFFTLFDSGIALGSMVFGIIAVTFNYLIVYLSAASIVLLAMFVFTLRLRKTELVS
ncbi:predicted MFS family arabinose efflux permease [Ureibacillus acetophenoni]|uniref:Predicted MFS family arabinose efflux permease n=1 Tax=Ureibacillus acetophenoni TaxID=614649 RepID=A0A285USB4_9BACL|nr:predicted MFS family arabinose efflux permease [Ureibacillus acetophenoni]